MEETIHIQSKEARQKITSVFCKLIALSGLMSVFFYLYLKIYELAAATGFITLMFLFFVYLNLKRDFNGSRIAIVITTNLGVIFFSSYLGYESGIYLYLFVAPLLVYLLFDFNEKKQIISLLLMYLLTFLFIYFNKQSFFSESTKLSPEVIKLIYSFNFCSAFILCFGLVVYFANNNDKYILNLTQNKQMLIQEVSLRTESEELLKKSLKEREILLSEIHHRVKNNLAIISALINMQIENLKEDSSKQIFEETKNRIYAMALIHNLLYQNNSFVKIDFVQYMDKFCSNIIKSYQNKSFIKIDQQIEDVEVDLKMAIPLALIMNELVTNAFKHAFKDQNSGNITVGIKKIENNQLKFWVTDNGVGMQEELINSNSMGMNIVKALVEQIDGKLTYENNGGSQFVIMLPI